MKTAAVIFLFLFCNVVFAAQSAKVITDGAMVYKKGDFDSAVIGYLRAGDKVRLSSKKFGAFYRIQFKQGIIGYISDVDVDAEEEGEGAESMPTSKKNKVENYSGSEGRTQSFISKTYFGFTYGMLNYSEVFNDSNKSESLNFYGAKFTTPMRYLSGPFVLDTSLIYQNGCPSYYNMTSPTSQAVSGKILIYDLQVMYSLAESMKRTFWVYMGGGIAANYSSFVIELNGSKQDLSDVLFGGVLTGGLAYRVGRFALKMEPRYYAMKSNYFAVLGSLQYQF